MPIALAPFALLPLALWWATAFLHTSAGPLYALHGWIVAALLTASMPSRTDWNVALPALALLTCLLLFGWIVWQVWAR
jgi:hypothetical protein